ncbi:MAG: hypothetical protein K9H49_09320 [Bacteroidales bacterium]|nr:hypothetical protein [Bacteroidales bacterium]MCF8390103.1 hypothetical protein [Bacteroidales bacterium]
METEKIKNIIFTKNIAQINPSDLKALIAEFPYFDILHLIELMHIKENDPKKFKNILPASAIFFSDKKILHSLLNSDLRNRLLNEHAHGDIAVLKDSESEALINEADTNSLLDFTDSGSEKINVTDHESQIPQAEEENAEEESNPEQEMSLIDRFLIEEPGPIRADKKTTLTGDVSQASVLESENLLTDTLAKIYVKQGLYNKAIYAYEKLSLKYPEKSVYFASQIKEITEVINKK